MGKLLKPSSTGQYVEKGYCHPIDVLTREEAAVCLAHLERYESNIGQPIDGKYRHKPHLLFPWLHDLICHPRVLDAVEDVLGPNILCWGSSFFIKEPEDPGYVSWHQDATYWGLDEPDVCTAWIALTPSTRANGCMRVASGSHSEQLTHTDTFHKDNLLSRGQEINAEVDEKDAVDLELLPGQMSLHHVRIIHGSNPNPTKTRRVGFAIRYIAATVRQSLGPRDFATLVRGKVVNDFWELEPRPKDELDAEALAYHEHMCDVQAKMLFAGAENAKPFQARSERSSPL